MVTAIKKEMDSAITSGIYMSNNERILGTTLVDVLENKELITPILGGGNKHDKLAIMEVSITNSGLTGKEVRLAMRRYKTLYNLTKNIEINGD